MSSDSKQNEEKNDSNEGSLPKLPSRTCSVLAHNKIVLHSLKYLSNSILGVLIGIRYKGENNSNNIHVMDAIPILHNPFSSMVVELAFLQIETWLSKVNKTKKSKGELEIVGVYFANDNIDDRTKSTAAILIISQIIKESSKTSVLLCQLDNERIMGTFDGQDTCLDWYCLGNNGNLESDRDWKEIDSMWYTTSKYCNTWSDIDITDEKYKQIKNGTNDKNNKNNKQKIIPKYRKSNNRLILTKENIIKYEEYLCHTECLTVIKNNDTGLGPLVQEETETILTDFEDQLDDLSKDWRNIF